ncbi:MAG: hypothetical protein HY788_01410 [Deltaproteobacteria bacterium]|nr:hypothetical protein [Deltaproteobacteria bacterium]
MENPRAIVENDLILIHVQHNPGFFARVEEIVADRKPGWWQVRILPLSLDNSEFQSIVWILDDQQIRGEEFTMQSVPMRIQRVEPYASRVPSKPKPEKNGAKSGKVISLVKK